MVASALTDVEVRLDMLGARRWWSGATNNAASERYLEVCGGERIAFGDRDRTTNESVGFKCVFD